MTHIVVADPQGEWWEGALVTDDMARVLVSKGVTLLPVEPTLMKLNAGAGFAKRAWGSGWALPAATPQRNATLSLYVHHDMHQIHWCARLAPTAEAFDSEGKLGRLQGSLRLAPDTTQHGTLTADIDMSERGRMDADQLGPMDSHGGWTVGGKVLIRMSMDGYVGLCLYGAARGLKVVWAAVSQTGNN